MCDWHRNSSVFRSRDALGLPPLLLKGHVFVGRTVAGFPQRDCDFDGASVHNVHRFYRHGLPSPEFFPSASRKSLTLLGDNGIVRCKERLGGLLKYYEQDAA
jgi:hypothetical protein